MKRSCLGLPGQPCGRLFEGIGSRCPAHRQAVQRQRDLRRGTPSARGYDWTYQQNRRAVLATGEPCAWCGRPATTADHVVPLAKGGTSALDNLIPCCRWCNSSRGSKATPNRR